MEDSSRHLKGTPQLRGVNEVAVVDKRHISLDMPYDERLDIVVALTASSRVADVSHSHISAPELCKLVPCKDLGDKSVGSLMSEYSVVADSYPTAFLSSVLECIEPEIHRSRHVRGHIFEYAENSALLMNAVKHQNTSVTNTAHSAYQSQPEPQGSFSCACSLRTARYRSEPPPQSCPYIP